MNMFSKYNEQIKCKTCGEYYTVSDDGINRCPHCGSVEYPSARENTGTQGNHAEEYAKREALKREVVKRRDHFRKLVIGLLAFVVVSIITAFAGFSSAHHHNQEIRNGYKYIEASIKEQDYFNALTKINDMRAEFKNDSVSSRLDEYYDDVVSGVIASSREIADAGDYDSAISMLQEAYAVSSDSRIGVAIAGIKDQRDNMIIQEAMSKNDYTAVIDLINKSAEKSDSNGGQGDRTTVKNAAYAGVIKDAQQKAADGDYFGAIVLLETIEKDASETGVTDLIKEYRVKMIDEKLSSDEYKEITSKIIYLRKEIQEHDLQDTKIASDLNAYSSEYREFITEEADTAYHESGQPAAVSKVNEGLSVLPDDEHLKELLAHYKSLKPVSLSEISCFHGYDLELYSLMDNFGVTHNDCLRTIHYDTDFDNTYRLDSDRFTKFEMDLIVDNEYKGNMPNDTGLRIYLDDNLAYTHISHDEDRESIHISLDITGVTDLRISLDRERNWGRHMIARNAVLLP